MSAMVCSVCGKYRKWGNLFDLEGMWSPPCRHCDAPGWMQTYDDPECTCGDNPVPCPHCTAHAPLDRGERTVPWYYDDPGSRQ